MALGCIFGYACQCEQILGGSDVVSLSLRLYGSIYIT